MSFKPGSASKSDMNKTMTVMARDFAPTLFDEDSRDHYLVLLEGWEPGFRLQFAQKPILVGRNPACDLAISDAMVSGRHCDIWARPGQSHAVLTDLNSTNGTFVDGRRITGTLNLGDGAILQLGSQVFRHEYRRQSEVESARAMQRDLDKANNYVQSLLPKPLTSGPIHTEWRYLPSTRLGGDGFGYHHLDDQNFACYLLDVTGHGTGAAMHAVSVLNVLRQRAMPGIDFYDPAQVLRGLNAMFQMDDHDGMLFSIWYGVYNLGTRQIRYASAGHHPSYLLVSAQCNPTPLQTRSMVIGAMPGVHFVNQDIVVPKDARLYLFSDGVFEVIVAGGAQWTLDDFLPLLTSPRHDGVGEAERLYHAVRAVARPGPFDDDFSLLTVRFL